MNSMNASPLLVMSGNDMAVRVGDSDVNLLDCGQMGSGTSWAPASSQLHMYDKLAGNWVLMFHFNAIVGVNSQGGLVHANGVSQVGERDITAARHVQL